MATSSEPNIREKRKRKRGKKTKRGATVPMMPVFVMNPYMNVEPGQMPMFHSGKSGQVPYQLAFAPMAVHRAGKRPPKKNSVKNSKGHTVSFNSEVGVSPEPSTTSLPQSSKMMTFSSLRLKQHQRTRSADVVPTGGSFTGHASVGVSTINPKVVKKGIMKKSASDSSTVGKS